jgi:pyrimidine-specific ribonucleoside hydrolase
MQNIVWDMETGDPDDFLTLLLLLGHPAVTLKAVTVTPGAPDQIGLVRRALSWFGRDLPVGSNNIDHPRNCVSAWHYRVYGNFPPSREAEPVGPLLARLCDANTTLVTGGPPKNLGDALMHEGFSLGCWVAQGGFAGEGVVPADRQLPKFRGRTVCPSYNFNGAPQAARDALASPAIGSRYLVSKNVCHGAVYDAAVHAQVGAVKDRSLSLRLIWQGMDAYLRRHPEGKALHDTLAACCAIDPAIGTWEEVTVFHEQGGWGARKATGTRTYIITGYDPAQFLSILLAV